MVKINENLFRRVVLGIKTASEK